MEDRRTILVCDDEAVLRALVRATLEGDGYSIVEARDAGEALDRARGIRPDLILLDQMMPGRTGLVALAELRADPELAGIPVVMLTARAQVADREAAENAGATRFLTKPFSPDELAVIVAELVEADR